MVRIHRCPGVLICLLVAAFATDSHAAKKWRVKEDCTVIANKANDGDSFHVRINKRHYLFRLYWVDAPETDMGVPERVAEQAEYFGITPEEAIKYGKEAAKFTEEFLKGTFTVHTKFADAMGRSTRDRDYGIVERDGKFLHIELVRAGLARIHGFQEVSDDMPEIGTMRMRVKAAEAEAKKEKRGAWSKGSGKGDTISGPRILSRSITILDTEDPSRALGVLRAGARIEILGVESPTLLRIQFKAGETDREGLCQRSELGM